MAKTQVRSTNIEDGGVTRSDLNVSTVGSAVIAKIIAGAGISVSSTGADAGTGDVTISVATGGVTLAMLANLTGKSVIGRAGAGTSTVAAITAVTASHVLRMADDASGIAWGTLDTGGITAAAVTLAKMADVATSSVFYRKTAGTGVPEVNSLATLKTDLGLTGTNTGDQTITLTGNVTGSGTGSFAATIANSAVTYAKIQNAISGLSVIGCASSTPGVLSEITGTANQVFRVNNSGTTLGFGTVATAGITDSAVTLTKMADMATASFIGRNTAGTGPPEVLNMTVAKTMLGIGGPYQPLDGDLTSLSAAAALDDIYYRSGVDTWSTVKVSGGIEFKGGVLRLITYRTGARPADDTKASASTLDLTGLNGPTIEVTGTTNISAITLADGEQRGLIFSGAGLTLVNSSSLPCPGGKDLPIATGGFALVLGGAAGVVTVTDAQTAERYSTQTFDNIFMRAGANIGYDDPGTAYFDVGRGPSDPNTAFMRFYGAAPPQLVLSNLSSHTDLMPGATSAIFTFPSHDGTGATLAGTESLTNKKLGSLTGNGFVKTSGGDGTLSVDTTAYASITYVDNQITGLKFKQDCRVASTANVSVSSAPASIDGVTLSSLDRVLLKNQTAGAENGPYLFNGTGNAMTRTTDGDSAAELISATFPIREGIVNQDTWFTITNDTITVGSTALVFSQTGGTGTYVAGSGLTLTGNSFGITTGGVTLAMMANMATASFIGRNTASTGVPEILSIATAKTMLGLTGTNSGDQTITLTGDVTGTGTGSFATTLSTVPVTKGGTGVTTLAAHGVLIGNGASAVAVTGTGTAGQVLTSNGASADPTFQTGVQNDDARIKLDQALGSTNKAQTIPLINLTSAGVALADNTAYFAAIYIATPRTITGMQWYQTTKGNYTADQNNELALYSYSAGTLTRVAISANIGSLWSTANSATFGAADFGTPYAAAAGVYYVAILYNFSATTTNPALGVAGALQNAAIGGGSFTNGAMLYGTITGVNALASSYATTDLTASTVGRWLALY